MNTTASPSRPRSLTIAAGTWILLVSALVVADHVRFSRSINDRPPDIEPARVAALASRIAALQATVSALEHQPAPVRAAQYDATEHAQNAELSQFENSLSDVVHSASLAPLTQQVTRLRVEVWRLRHPVPPHPLPLTKARYRISAMPPRAPDTLSPFHVLGTELRGGEQFLAVAPQGAHSLSQVQVLRAGETDENWTLEAIDGRTAVFKHGGVLRRMSIP